MSQLVFLICRTYLITLMTIGMMASLTDFRLKGRKLLRILILYSIWCIVSSALLLWLGGELLLLRLFFFTISIPAILLAYWAANDTPAQAVFNYATQILLSLLSVSMIRWVADTLHLSNWANLLLTALFYSAAIYLEWRFLRRPFRMLLTVIPSHWGILTLIPCSFCLYLIFLASWPVNYIESSSQRAYLYIAIIPLVVVYVAVFKLLVGQYQVLLERQNAALLTVQISALKEKLQTVQEVEEDIKIQRHDLRHQLQTVTELVARGDTESALKFLDAAQKHLDEQKKTCWCHLPVLDAVFSAYFNQAQQQGIRLETKIASLSTLPVEESELAIVLANALENAIHANKDLPPGQKEIRCKMVGTPSVMVEISNPYAAPVTFNDEGLPVSSKEGHGFGVQSIAAFCKKHGAVCQFEAAEGRFCLKLVL